MGPETSTWRMKLAASGRWFILLALPVFLNAFVWLTVVGPQQAALQAARNAQATTALKPQLSALVTESEQVITEVERSTFTSGDPTKVTQAVERLAGVHHLHVKTITTTGERAVSAAKGATPHATERSLAGSSTLPIDVEVTGSFSKLAHWVSDLETQSGLQVDAWTIRPEAGDAHACTMMVKIIAFLRNGSAT